MFGLFKRTKIKKWELDLLREVLNKLDIDGSKDLLNQIDSNLIRGVLTNISDIKGYVAFTYNFEIVKKFENLKEKDYKIENVLVFDELSASFLDYTIYVSTGTISGYAINSNRKIKINPKNVRCLNAKKTYINNIDYDNLKKILTSNEIELINSSEVYLIEVNNKEFYKIKDIGDGDFIGIDKDKEMYKITHNPLEIKKIEGSLENIINTIW